MGYTYTVKIAVYDRIYRIPKLRFGRIQKYRTELSEETRGPRANLSTLFTKKLLKVATRRHFLSFLGQIWAKFLKIFEKTLNFQNFKFFQAKMSEIFYYWLAFFGDKLLYLKI